MSDTSDYFEAILIQNIERKNLRILKNKNFLNVRSSIEYEMSI